MAGHSVATSDRHYARVFEQDLAAGETRSEGAFRAARETALRPVCTEPARSAGDGATGDGGRPANPVHLGASKQAL
jgi:hypothetical protein